MEVHYSALGRASMHKAFHITYLQVSLFVYQSDQFQAPYPVKGTLGLHNNPSGMSS